MTTTTTTMMMPPPAAPQSPNSVASLVDADLETMAKQQKVFGPSRKRRVRFASSDYNLVVDPVSKEPLSALEKRSVWYTSKELQCKYQCDVDNVTNYHEARRAHKRHSMLSPTMYSHNSNHNEALPRRSSAPTRGPPSSSACWRGLEHHMTPPKPDQPSRTDRVKNLVKEVVALHKDYASQGLPALNEELRKASRDRTKSDRKRAEQMGLQDAKDAGTYGPKQALIDLMPGHHSTSTTMNSPTRQFRKLSALAKMSVTSALDKISAVSVSAH